MGKVLLGIAVGVVFVIVALVAFVTFFSGPELSVRISTPNSTLVGETFTIVLYLSNPHSEPVTLDSVDIDNAALATFEVISVTPEPSEPSPFAIFGQQSWTFQRVLEPATAETVEFEFRANLVGSYQVPLNVCNSYQDCSRILVPILVAPPAK